LTASTRSSFSGGAVSDSASVWNTCAMLRRFSAILGAVRLPEPPRAFVEDGEQPAVVRRPEEPGDPLGVRRPLHTEATRWGLPPNPRDMPAAPKVARPSASRKDVSEEPERPPVVSH